MPPDVPARDEHHDLTTSDYRQRLDLLMSLGCGLLESGQTSGQVQSIIVSSGRSLGLSELSFTTSGSLAVLEAHKPDGTTVMTSGAARALDMIDCTKSRALHHVVLELRDGGGAGSHTQRKEHLSHVREEIWRLREKATPWWATTLGLTMLAVFISMQVGVLWTAWVAAAAVQLVASLVGFAVIRAQMPKLFVIILQSSAGGAFATALVLLGFVDPVGAAAAIAVNWLLLLPLPQVIGAVTDAIGADYVSAMTRVASVGIAAVGISIGGVFIFALGDMLGMDHPALDELPTFPWYLVLVFSALGAMANAFANGGRASLLLPAAVIGVSTGVVNQVMLHIVGAPTLWASTVSGVALGLMTLHFAVRTGYPQQVLALMGVTGALLPGIPVFFGILQYMSGVSGADHLAHAGMICAGISAGVALGSYIAALASRVATRRSPGSAHAEHP